MIGIQSIEGNRRGKFGGGRSTFGKDNSVRNCLIWSYFSTPSIQNSIQKIGAVEGGFHGLGHHLFNGLRRRGVRV